MPATLDRSYDGVIIGAGHHGLVLGSYLARCGLDILLVDRRLPRRLQLFASLYGSWMEQLRDSSRRNTR